MNYLYTLAVILLVGSLAEANVVSTQTVHTVPELDCICTYIYKPVCGIKRGRFHTYPNLCSLNCDGALYAYEGECRVVVEPNTADVTVVATSSAGAGAYAGSGAAAYAGSGAAAYTGNSGACTTVFTPVCGIKNGRFHTYGNLCELKRDGAIYAHDGVCRVIVDPVLETTSVDVSVLPEACPAIYKPVCGIKLGRFHTYSNRCRLERDGAIYAYEGVCRIVLEEVVEEPALVETTVVTEVCHDRYHPVCGIKRGRFQTYRNRCSLEKDGAIYAYDGECRVIVTDADSGSDSYAETYAEAYAQAYAQSYAKSFAEAFAESYADANCRD